VLYGENAVYITLDLDTVREPTDHFPSLLELFNFRSKSEAMRHCAGLVVHRQDLVALILGAQHGALAPYRYANHFADNVPPHLLPSEAEHLAIQQNEVGKFQTHGARKFVSKIFQLFRARRVLAAHLFYTPNHRYWHLFYFDNRDTTKESKNHWKYGSHIHYISDLWSTVSMEQAWAQVKSGHVAFSSKAHLRYAS
jgi:hypothetical protein